MRRRAAAWHVAAAILAAALFAVVGTLALQDGTLRLPPEAQALPLYTARAGRTCDNCHTDPTGWKNPALRLRNCTLSCNGCHVNPTGGGLRTVSGRFYGQATLPVLFASHRGAEDWGRHIGPFAGLERERRNRLPEPAFGTPLGGSSSLAWNQKRYAGLNADPFFLIGVDLRLALWLSYDARVFPMQLDLHLAIHPVAHLTLFATGGVLAKSQGFAGTFSDHLAFGIKDIFVMVHELPYMLHMRVGRFIPQFGTGIDDHTSFVRRDFELDMALMESRVTGIEVALTPNYPYLAFALFRPGPRDLLTAEDPVNVRHPPLEGVDGWGASLSLGWRDLGWQVGLSGMLRRRELRDGGDTESASVQWGFNPWYYLEWLPLTYMGEVAFGRKQRAYSSTHAWQLAVYQEIDWLAFNGVNFRIKYDYTDPDIEVRDDHHHRVTFSGDLILLPGLALRSEMRMQTLHAPGASAAGDGLLYLRGWY